MGRGGSREFGVLRTRGSADELQLRGFVEGVCRDIGERYDREYVQSCVGIRVHRDR